MAYSGRWRTERKRVDRAAPLGRPELAELHMRQDFAPRGSRVPFAAPRVDIGPETIRDPGTSYDQVTPRQAPGNPLAHERESHYGYAAPGGTYGSRAAPSRRLGNAARSVDRGSALRQIWRMPRARAVDERRETFRLQVDPSSNGSRLGALRGANSLPENNPDGYRIGMRVQRWMNRKIPTRWRRHELRPLRIQLAAAAVESPPMEQGNVYTSPFAWGRSARRRVSQAPMERRSPRAWDEDVTGDGVTEGARMAPSRFESWAL